jgi:hypothetical protein
LAGTDVAGIPTPVFNEKVQKVRTDTIFMTPFSPFLMTPFLTWTTPVFMTPGLTPFKALF